MKKTIFILISSFIFFAGFTSAFNNSKGANKKEKITSNEIKDPNFDMMMQVIMHQRCMNCHPSGDRPLQGDDSHIHYFNIQRGEDRHGMSNAQCSTCHQSENNDFSGVPGAPHWHLAPKSMAWQGLSRTQIAKAFLDKNKNGGKSMEAIGKHLTEDPLVLWAFEPGVNNEGEAREKPPVSKEDFIKAVKEWIANGANIPEE